MNFKNMRSLGDNEKTWGLLVTESMGLWDTIRYLIWAKEFGKGDSKMSSVCAYSTIHRRPVAYVP